MDSPFDYYFCNDKHKFIDTSNTEYPVMWNVVSFDRSYAQLNGWVMINDSEGKQRTSFFKVLKVPMKELLTWDYYNKKTWNILHGQKKV